MSRWAARIALLVGATALTLGVLEVGVRLFRPAANDFFEAARRWGMFVEWDREGGYYRGVPNGRLTAAGIEYRFNSWGLRGPEPPATKPAGTIRIVTLGDSVTNGSGVAYDDSFPALLARDLAPRHVDVFPLAMGGWNTVAELNCLTRYIGALAPDVVVLLYVINDTDVIDPWEAAKQPPTTIGGRIYRTLVVNSRLFEWAAWQWVRHTQKADWAGLRDMVAREEKEKALGPPFTPTHPSWLKSREALVAMARLVERHGAKLVVYGWNMGSYQPGPVMLDRLREFGAEYGVPVFDTAQLYTDRDPLLFWVLPFHDSHPNAEGHRRLADYIAKTLDGLGLLGPRVH